MSESDDEALRFLESRGWPAATLSLITGLDIRTLTRLAEAGAVHRVKRGHYDLIRSLRSIIRHYIARAAGRESGDGEVDAVKSNAQFKDSQRRLTDLKVGVLEGKLVAIEELEEVWADLVQSTKQLFLNAAARIQFDLPHLTATDREQIERVLRDMLEEVAISGRVRLPGEGARKHGESNGFLRALPEA